ncbi:nuclease-related domain-containing protein [Neobacillus drentensis]|uniref:nuclease-related domain-containing protein n=1 Tax=Neobacillus drentensis TaxID=220684 RepID=UPI0030011E2B
MLFKSRIKSDELKILSYLNTRMNLPENDKQYFLKLKKGFEGELMFDLLTEKLHCHCLILNDLLLKVNNTTFQIDTLIIKDTLHLFEVKNYKGDYYFEDDKFYPKKSENDILNPLDQIKRGESLLQKLLHQHGFNFFINAKVIFINPEFTLYQAPKDKPIIYPTQINSFMKNFDNTSLKLNNKHRKLAELLVSLHISKSSYTQIPTYHYSQCKKGITCSTCDSFLITVEGRNCRCLECGQVELVESAVLRIVEEIKVLFPGMKITTNLVNEWCSVVGSKKRISRILEKNFKIVGVHQWAFYE